MQPAILVLLFFDATEFQSEAVREILRSEQSLAL